MTPHPVARFVDERSYVRPAAEIGREKHETKSFRNVFRNTYNSGYAELQIGYYRVVE